jgi:hypothetical protein
VPHHQTRDCARVWLVGLLLLVACGLGACGAGQNGGDALAFIRGGALYRMQPDGSGRFRVTPGQAIGFAWSPDHHQLVARYAAVTNVPAAHTAYPGVVPDVAAALGVVSIDGGNIIPITRPTTIPVRGDPWWDANGNRLFYRERVGDTIQWILSQSDQPNGIARKAIANSAITANAPTGTLWPTSAPDASQIAYISDAGDLVLVTAGGGGKTLQHGVARQLAGGAVARPLWQPHHSAILYTTSDGNGNVLWLTDLAGHAARLLTGTFDNVAWSPDGAHILLHTGGNWGIYTAGGTAVMMWGDNGAGAVAWWSPDGRHVLARSATHLTLVTLAGAVVTPLATFTAAASGDTEPGAYPLTGSPWSADSGRIALVTGAAHWHDDTALPSKSGPGTGLYIIPVNATKAAPKLSDWGEHTVLSWSTPDPNTQLLAP